MDVLHSTSSARVYAAIRERDQRPVVAKLFDIGGDVGTQIERELTQFFDLAVDGVPQALALTRAGRYFVLIREWCDGISLGRYCGDQPLSVEEFIPIALKVSRILAEVHEQGIVHRNIRPSNILIDPSTKDISLIGLGVSTLLEREWARVNDPEVLANVLPYVAPEQGGRSPHEVDARTDLYSLGVSFYELLCARRPFAAPAPHEAVHAHLLGPVLPANRARPDLPEVVSRVVMKLMHEAPERRYQSARGLLADLERISASLEAGASLDDFELGSVDVPAVLQLPRSLYGRGAELELLGQVFRYSSSGQPCCVLISGPAGVGKRSLNRELGAAVSGCQGFLIRGGFGRARHEGPYCGFVAALSDLCDQLLDMGDELLAHWQRALQRELGSSAAVLVDLVPRLRAILGDSPPPVRLGPIESRNRLATCCARMFAVLARVEHPLVVALDDLHEADQASCELLAILLGSPRAALLITATLREDELTPDHPVRWLIDHVEDTQLTRIELGPLEAGELADFVADALALPAERARSLADIVGPKTNYNPALVRRYLAHIVGLELLRPTARGWEWSAEVETTDLPDDPAMTASARLGRLSADESRVLITAAVIGQCFEVPLLTALTGANLVSVCLASLTTAGLVTMDRQPSFRFKHEYIRRAALGLASIAERAALHRRICERWLQRVAIGTHEQPILEVIDHVDLGYGLRAFADEDPAQAHARARQSLAKLGMRARTNLAELHEIAGHRALTGAAPHAAARYFDAGIRLIADDSSTVDPGAPLRHLHFALELGRCQALSLGGERSAAEWHFDRLLDSPFDLSDIAHATAKRVDLMISSREHDVAIACAVAGLSRLDVELAHGDPVLNLARMLHTHPLGELGERARLDDARLEAASDILTAVLFASPSVDVELHQTLVSAHVRITLEGGLHPSSALGLVQAARVLGGTPELRPKALEVAQFARALARREGADAEPHHLEPSYWSLACWARPYADALTPLCEAVAAAVELGDLTLASRATAVHMTISLCAGVDLSVLERTCEAASHRQHQWDADPPLAAVARSYRRFAAVLLGEDLDAVEFVELSIHSDHERSLCVVKLLRTRLFYLFGRWREAFEELQAIAAHTFVEPWHMTDHVFLHGLSAAALAVEAGPGQAAEGSLLAVVEGQIATLESLSALAPVVCAARVNLLEAELHAARGQTVDAFSRYRDASRGAATQGDVVVEAISLERMACFARAHDLDELAEGPIRRARECYRSWGALSKVVALERQWPELPDAGHPRAGGPTPAHAVDPRVNLAAVLEASQVIAEDLHFEDVVTRVMAIVLDHTGAERGALLLLGESGFEFAALASADSFDGGVLAERVPMGASSDQAPVSLLNWAERNREPVIVDDAATDKRFAADPYIEAHGVRSALCLPIVKQTALIGLLYLEDTREAGIFADERLAVLELLMTQAGSALENAQLFEALRVGEERWRSLVEGLPDVVFVVGRGGRIQFINHLGEDRARKRLIGAKIIDFIHADDQPRARAHLDQVITEARRSKLELRASLSASTMGWYSIRLAPVVVDGRVDRTIIVATDITEQREAQLARQQIEAQLRQQQRLESIGTLASGVAHEINNPVQGIMNYADLITQRPHVDPTTREFAGEIVHESQRVAIIVRDLLAFSRTDSADHSNSVTAGEIIDGTLSLMGTVMRKDQIELCVDLPEAPLEVECRIQQIQQVLINLLTNARDALCERWPDYHCNKRIDLVARPLRVPGDGERSSWIRISVRDAGGGVPSQLASRIFDPFFTTKGRDKGTGLGLSVSHGIIAEHGGELRLENQPGTGACFHIELPVLSRRVAAAPPAR